MKEDIDLEDFLNPSPIRQILLNLYRSTIGYESGYFQDYIRENRESINAMQAKLDQNIKEALSKYPEKEDEITSYFDDKYHRYYELYPAFFSSSTFISLYSFFEYNLKNICEVFQINNKIKLSIDDLSGGDYIEKCKKYMVKIIGLDINDLDKEWDELKKFQHIRNKIVHHMSRISVRGNYRGTDTYKIINEDSSLQLNESSGVFIINDDDYLIRFCNVMDECLLAIVKKMEKIDK